MGMIGYYYLSLLHINFPSQVDVEGQSPEENTVRCGKATGIQAGRLRESSAYRNSEEHSIWYNSYSVC